MILQNDRIRIETFDVALAGGIGSIKLDGKEILDLVDKGRGCQTACQLTGNGLKREQWNPNEQGSVGIAGHLPTNSVLIYERMSNGRLETKCKAAYWLPRNGQIVSDTYISRSTKLESWGMDCHITIDPEGEDETDPTLFVAEILTGYSPAEFSDMRFVTPTSTIKHTGHKSKNDGEYPCYISTPDGKHAIGAICADAKQYALIDYRASSGNTEFVADVLKWSVVTSDRTPDNIYNYHVRVFIGTRDEVKTGLRGNVVDQPVEDMDCNAFYKKHNPDVAENAYFGDPQHPERLREHYDRHGKAKGRIACPEWVNEVIKPLTCDEFYKKHNPDVAENAYFGDPKHPERLKEHYDNHGRAKGRKACPEWRDDIVTPPPPPPAGDQPPTGRYITLNDFQHSLTLSGGGDPDSAPDFANQIATMHHYNELPLAVGCTWMEGQPVDTIPKELLKLAQLDIPTVLGSANKKGGASPLANLIIKESKRRDLGALGLVVGGTTVDIRYAFQNGADYGNVVLYLTPDTWNALNSDGATKYIMSLANATVITPKGDLWYDLGVKYGRLKILGMTPDVWIENKRSNAMWNAANSRSKINQIRSLNTQLSTPQSNHPIRSADYRHLNDYFGRVSSHSHDEIHRRIDNGIKILNARLANKE